MPGSTTATSKAGSRFSARLCRPSSTKLWKKWAVMISGEAYSTLLFSSCVVVVGGGGGGDGVYVCVRVFVRASG